MLLIGVNRSPFTRRVAITLNVYGVLFEHRPLSGFDNRADVRTSNPLGRIPALVLDSGETLIDSNAIIDHLDEVYGRERALMPAAGADRRSVLKISAMMMGACEKCLHAAYEENRRPAEKRYQPWIDDCMAQVVNALSTVDAMIKPEQSHLLLGRFTHADITAVVAERFARLARKLDTATQMPRLHALTSQLAQEPAFSVSEP